jgi:hypothetical protein
LILSLVLPLIIIPIKWSAKINSTAPFTNTFLTQAKQTITQVAETNVNPIQINSGISSLQIILYSLFAIYLIGIVFRTFLFAKNLINIYGFIKKNSKVKEKNYWLVNITNQVPAFSFFNYIFINYNYKDLSSAELQTIKDHELIHVKQYHTLDILFVELVGILFWFNPLVSYLKRSLKEIHEYIVDESIAGKGENKKAYAHLLLSLASETKVFDLATSFTGEHIKRRILMIAKPRTSEKYKLRFIIIFPLSAILLISFSCMENGKTEPILEPLQIIESKDWSTKTPFALQIDLKKYCGNYGPMVTDTFLRPMEILNIDNKLFRFIKSDSTETNRTVELKFISTNKFGYTDFSGRTIEFILDSNNVVTGCILVRKDGTYKLYKENC